MATNSDGLLYAYVYSGESASDVTMFTPEPGKVLRVGIAWADGVFRLYADGRSYGSLDFGAPSIDRVSVGSDYAGASPWGGAVRKIATFDPAPSAGDMLRATGSRSSGDAVLGRTIRIAAVDSSAKAQEAADLICDGLNDQAEINAAIAALSATGGSVLLADGTYNVRRTTAPSNCRRPAS